MGVAYIVSVVSLFDEYVNDLLYLQEGSCLPRCIYHLLSFDHSCLIICEELFHYKLMFKFEPPIDSQA